MNSPIKEEKIPLSQMDIDQLAMKHLSRHWNDRSDRYLARMKRRWGKETSYAALNRAKETIKMMGLEPRDIRPGYVPSQFGKGNPFINPDTNSGYIIHDDLQQDQNDQLDALYQKYISQT